MTACLIVLFIKNDIYDIMSSFRIGSFCLYAVPSAIYLILNNIHFAALARLDASSYQILSNLKIVTTGIAFRLFFKRRLIAAQWIGLLLLTVGTTISQYRKPGLLLSAQGFQKMAEGYTLAILGTVLSASAGVYTEYLMKRTNDSIFFQNLQLYLFGVLLNGLKLTLDDVGNGWRYGSWISRIGVNYNTASWLVMGNMALTGILISWIMKYADVLVKVYATSMAMILTTVMSILLFGLQPNPQLFLGIAVCGLSLHLYFSPNVGSLLPRYGKKKETLL